MFTPHPAPLRSPGRYPAPPSPALAVVALVTGVLGLVTIPVLGVLAVPLGLAGVVTGAVALARRVPGRGMAVAGLVTGAVGVVVDLVLTALVVGFYGSVLLLGAAGALDDQPAGDPTGGAVGEFGYGEPATLDDYAVSVDGVHAEGDVVFAEVTARYTGDDAGNAYDDLYGYLYDADGEEFAATDCAQPLHPDALDLPDVRPGQTVTFQVCFEGVAGTDGARVEVVDGEGWGSYADWTDEVTLEGPSSTAV